MEGRRQKPIPGRKARCPPRSFFSTCVIPEDEDIAGAHRELSCYPCTTLGRARNGYCAAITDVFHGSQLRYGRNMDGSRSRGVKPPAPFNAMEVSELAYSVLTPRAAGRRRGSEKPESNKKAPGLP